jgi:hypothetical protein
MEPDE